MCGSDSSKGPSTSRLWWGPKKQSSWAPMHFLSNYYFRRILVGWGWGVFLCGCVNVCKHTCRPQVKLRYLSSRTLSTLFFETGYLICQVLSKQSRLADYEALGELPVCVSSSRITSLCHHTWLGFLHVGSRDHVILLDSEPLTD